MWTNQLPLDSLRFDAALLGEDYKLSRNFRLREALCHDGEPVAVIHPATLLLAQAVRDEVGGPIRIHSWFRTKAHNAAVGGKDNSTHLYGMAFDWSPVEGSVKDWANVFRGWEIGGVGIYETFIHLDVYGEHRRWHG